MNKTKWIIVSFMVIVILSIVGALGYFFLYSNSDSQNRDEGVVSRESSASSRRVSQVCSDHIITESSSAIESYDRPLLEEISKDIEKQNDYRLDINCDYILANYYLMVSDSVKAATYIDEIELARSAGARYSLRFSPPAQPVSVLKKSLEVVKSQEAQSEQYRELNAKNEVPDDIQ